MKRKTFVAELREGGKTLAMAEKSAWNSAVRASEALVRDLAHDTGEAFVGGDPAVWGKPPTGVYRRTWRGESTGRALTVEMQEVTS